MRKYQYHFSPLPVENGPPPAQGWNHPREYHPDALGQTIRGYALPADLYNLVNSGSKSASHTYYGFKKNGEVNFLHFSLCILVS